MRSFFKDNSVYDDAPMPAPRGHRRMRIALAVAVTFAAGAYLAALRDASPVVVTEEVEEVSMTDMPSPRALGAAGTVVTPPPNGSAEAEVPACEGMHPGPSWSCQDGKWQIGPGVPAPASGGGRIDRAGGCLTEQPGPLFECQGGLWMIRGSSSASPTPATTPETRNERECPAPAPGSDWRCDDGAWEPPTPAPPAPEPVPSTPPGP